MTLTDAEVAAIRAAARQSAAQAPPLDPEVRDRLRRILTDPANRRRAA